MQLSVLLLEGPYGGGKIWKDASDKLERHVGYSSPEQGQGNVREDAGARLVALLRSEFFFAPIRSNSVATNRSMSVVVEGWAVVADGAGYSGKAASVGIKFTLATFFTEPWSCCGGRLVALLRSEVFCAEPLEFHGHELEHAAVEGSAVVADGAGNRDSEVLPSASAFR